MKKMYLSKWVLVEAINEWLKQRGDKAAADFQQFLGTDLPAFNVMLRDQNIGKIYLKTP